MSISTSRFVSAFLTFVLLPIVAAAAPQEFNGHYYEVIAYPSQGSPDKTWDTAKTAAEAAVFMDVNGHLATVTSEGEDLFVEALRAAAGLSAPEAWVGGSTESDCDPVPGCGWLWVNGEGVISTPQVSFSSYSNWLGGEPNNVGIGERHLGIGLAGLFGWNDEGNLGNIGGYVIEYDVPLPIPQDGCANGCPVSQAADVTLPDSVILEPDAQIDVRRYEFTDDLAACGLVPRELFGIATDPDDEIPDAILPAYLCGSPKFQVIVAETTGATIPSGTVLVETETSDVFPNNLYDCTGPINPDTGMPVTDLDRDPADPQNRDVVGWSRSDMTTMPEHDLGAANGFPGSVAEVNFECGSSRGKGNSFSLYFVGLHIDFGPGAEISVNPALNHDKFVELTRYKIVLLKETVTRAFNDDAISYSDYRYMLRDVGSALRSIDRGNYAAALSKIETFIGRAETISYDTSLAFNHNGEHLLRASSIVFMFNDKVIQGAP